MYIKAFIATIITFLVVDVAWISLVLIDYYERVIGGIMRETPARPERRPAGRRVLRHLHGNQLYDYRGLDRWSARFRHRLGILPHGRVCGCRLPRGSEDQRITERPAVAFSRSDASQCP